MHESKSMNIKLLNIDVIFKVVRKFEKDRRLQTCLFKMY